MLFVLLLETGEYQITGWGSNGLDSDDYIILMGEVEHVIRYLLGKKLPAEQIITCLRDAHEGVEVRYLPAQKPS